MGYHHIAYWFVCNIIVIYCHIAICVETGFVGILVLHAKNSIRKKQSK